MRQLQRATIVVLGIALVGLAPAVGSSAAAEQTVATERVVSSEADPRATERRKPRRGYVRFWSRIYDDRTKVLLGGRVENCRKCLVKLMRSNDNDGPWRYFRSKRAWKSGKFRFWGMRKPGWYRIKVPGNSSYRTTWSRKRLRIYRP